MKIFNWQVKTAALLIAVSALLYFIFALIYDIDAYHIVEKVFGHVAFLPMHVLIITLIIHGLLDTHKKKQMLEKLNIVIGTFHGEVGADLLRILIKFDKDPAALSEELIVSREWDHRHFKKARKKVAEMSADIDATAGDLAKLKSFLSEKRVFLLRLMENPNLLEHDDFTDLLWAVFHLTDELNHRDDLAKLPKSDYEHLSVDIKRTYVALIESWLPYMKHLKEKYPYLFSLALRTNPFDREASVTVKE
jgi:hypothetical protein